jgi:hypothetical protein
MQMLTPGGSSNLLSTESNARNIDSVFSVHAKSGFFPLTKAYGKFDGYALLKR